jgi:cell division protein FtsB
MTGVNHPLALMRRAALPALGVLVIANFLGYAIVGDNGVLSWGDYRRIKAERAVELAQLEQERARLVHRAQLLDPRRADPDLAEELVRREHGLVRPDEVIIEIEDTASPEEAPAATGSR